MKGVFCIEGFWYGDHRDTTSVYPVLDLVKRYQNLPFLHHRCGTYEEFCFSIKRWKNKTFHKKYPMLYLAFHGKKGAIEVGKQLITLEQLAEILEDKCSGVVVYFGSCETMNVDKRKLQSFMEKTKTVAILGFKEEVDWLTSASFDIKLLSLLLTHPFDTKGVKKILSKIKTEYSREIKNLDFRMEINERIRFSRPRKRIN